MARIKTYEKYYKKKQIIVYAIYFPFGNRIYVGKTLKHAVQNHYKDHYILRYNLTKNYFQEAKERSYVPKMYLLEELNAADADAYRHCVAWVRYFIDRGFHCITHDGTREYALDLLEETQEIYEKIQTLSVEDVLHDNHILVSHVRSKRKNKTDQAMEDYEFIGFRATKEDVEKIRVAAEEKQWSLSEYCRAAAVDGCIVNVDFNFLWRYIDELKNTEQMLEQTILTIQETGKYHQQDLDNIQNKIDLVLDCEERINREINAVMETAQEEIRAAKRSLS